MSPRMGDNMTGTKTHGMLHLAAETLRLISGMPPNRERLEHIETVAQLLTKYVWEERMFETEAQEIRQMVK